MEPLTVYVLVTLGISAGGEVTRRNVGVTFNIHEAEAHAALDIANEYEKFEIEANWRDDAEMSALVVAMRSFRECVDELRAEALR